MDRHEGELAERFGELVCRPAASIALDEVAFVVAQHADAEVDMSTEIARLDELAAAVSEPTLHGVLRLLFRDLGYRGNREDYYDTRNSLLHCVLARRTGIPITLSIVVIEVGRRLGVPLSGVGMPGHFLIRDKVDPNVFVDPFNAGALLDAGQCLQLFRQVNGAGAAFMPEYLDPVPHAAIIARLLANLRSIYAGRGELHSLCWVARLRARLPEADAAIWREYAMVAGKVGRLTEAAVAYERAATLDPARAESDQRDAASMRARLN